MGIANGLCGVDEFYDHVSGLCGHCSDVCRDIAKSNSFCIYHCSDYYSRLLSTTAISLQEEKPITLLVIISALVLVIVCMMVTIAVIIYRFRYLNTRVHKRKRYKFPGFRNAETEFTVTRFRHRHRVNRHNSVQETRDPNKQEDMQLSVLCVSPCSSLVLGAESTTEGKGFQYLAHDLNPVYMNRDGSKHYTKTDAIVSVDAPFCSEFEETQLKIACSIESSFLPINDGGSGELVKQLSNSELTCSFETDKIHPNLDDEDVMKHCNTGVHESRLYVQPSEHDNRKGSSTSVQEIRTFASSTSVHSDHNDRILHAPVQESYKGGPS